MLSRGTKARNYRSVRTLGCMHFSDLFLLSSFCFASCKDSMMTRSNGLQCFFSVLCQFDVAAWIRSSSPFAAMPLTGVVCPSPLQRFHEASLPASFTWHYHRVSSRVNIIPQQQQRRILIPFSVPSFKALTKSAPIYSRGDGLIIAPACLSPSRALLLIGMQLFLQYFIRLDSESQWSLVSQSTLENSSCIRVNGQLIS